MFLLKGENMSWFIEAFLYSCLCFFVPAVMTRIILKLFKIDMRKWGCGFGFFILFYALFTLRIALTTLSFIGLGILPFWFVWFVIDIFIYLY